MSNRIRELRTKLNISQEELAYLAGTTQSNISNIERGLCLKIELATGIRIARALKKPVEYVFPDY